MRDQREDLCGPGVSIPQKAAPKKRSNRTFDHQQLDGGGPQSAGKHRDLGMLGNAEKR